MTVQFSHAVPAAESEPRRDSDKVQAMFFVTADAEPNIAPRLVEPFAKMGVVPERVLMSTEDGAGDEISADLRVSGVTPTVMNAIDKALRRVVGVRQVIALAE